MRFPDTARHTLMFIILHNYMLIFKMYWQMALHTTCWFLCDHLVAISMSLLSQKNSVFMKYNWHLNLFAKFLV